MADEERKQRLIEAAVAVLRGGGGSLKIVLANKALFFADLVALRDLGHTITENSFIALERGPVVAHYQKRLVKALEDLSLATQSKDGDAKPLVLTEGGRAFAPKIITGKEWEIAREVGGTLGKVTSTFISNFSHDNPGWIQAWETGGKKGSPKAIDMMLALQDPRLYEGGDWSEGDDDLEDDFGRAQNGTLTEWE